jgi:hypothetical protein
VWRSPRGCVEDKREPLDDFVARLFDFRAALVAMHDKTLKKKKVSNVPYIRHCPTPPDNIRKVFLPISG